MLGMIQTLTVYSYYRFNKYYEIGANRMLLIDDLDPNPDPESPFSHHTQYDPFHSYLMILSIWRSQ